MNRQGTTLKPTFLETVPLNFHINELTSDDPQAHIFRNHPFKFPCKWTSDKGPPLSQDKLLQDFRVVIKTGFHCISTSCSWYFETGTLHWPFHACPGIGWRLFRAVGFQFHQIHFSLDGHLKAAAIWHIQLYPESSLVKVRVGSSSDYWHLLAHVNSSDLKLFYKVWHLEVEKKQLHDNLWNKIVFRAAKVSQLEHVFRCIHIHASTHTCTHANTHTLSLPLSLFHADTPENRPLPPQTASPNLWTHSTAYHKYMYMYA